MRFLFAKRLFKAHFGNLKFDKIVCFLTVLAVAATGVFVCGCNKGNDDTSSTVTVLSGTGDVSHKESSSSSSEESDSSDSGSQSVSKKASSSSSKKSTSSTTSKKKTSSTTSKKSTSSTSSTTSGTTKPISFPVFENAVAKSSAVDISYFSDAVFLGASQTLGMATKVGLTAKSHIYAYQSLNVSTIYTNKVFKVGGKTVSGMDAMRATKFSKAYLHFGINEIWMSLDKFTTQYEKIIDDVLKVNPKAIVYVEAIMPVPKSYTKTSNSKINKYNKALYELAQKKGVCFLDVTEAVRGKDGYLPADAASDGIHFASAYCTKWFNYLKTHTYAEKEIIE